MQWDYVYADLQLQVTFDADGTSPFGQITDKEIMVLQQLIYMTLIEFEYIKAVQIMDIAALEKIIERTKKIVGSESNGG